ALPPRPRGAAARRDRSRARTRRDGDDAVRLWIGLVGAVIEAWGEVRIHKTRVLLSLIGVGVAVAALTTVVAGGAIATQATTESFERGGGRPATLFINAYNPMTGETPDQAAMDAAFDAAVERYSVDYAS